jgi:hypothetical protein
MTGDHHRVRDFAVQELIAGGKPLAPQRIAQELQLATQRVVEILDELEHHKTFVFRNSQGAVTWAYPVTVEPTPHRVRFSTGEQVYAAWAFDTLAVPFVQGHLRGEPVACAVETECGHCHQPLHIELNSELEYRVEESSADPMVYSPLLDVQQLDPSIIDGFW